MAVCDLDASKGQDAVKELQAEYGAGRVIFIKTDVTSAAELEGNVAIHESYFFNKCERT